MVTFLDPETNEEISYHIDEKLKKKWDKLRAGKLQKKDEDRVYIVDGRERTGKSVFAIQQAKYIDPSFNLSRVCFTPDEFLAQIRIAPTGSVVVFDEAFRGLSSKSVLSKVNKKIIQAIMEVGQRNLVIFIVLPTFFLLELYVAVLRSNALFHVYKDRHGQRAFRLYSYQKKSLLYNIGRKKGFSYSIPKVRIVGRFPNIYAIDEKAYRKKKLDSLKEVDSEEEGLDRREEQFKEKYHEMIWAFKNYTKLSEKKAAEALNQMGIEISGGGIGTIARKVGDKRVTTAPK